MTIEILQKEMIKALKEGNKFRKETISSLIAAVKKAAIDRGCRDNITEELVNQAFTTNGDRAFKSTGSFCLDYFSIVGGMRYNLNDALTLFLKSYYEDPILTIKILFYIRDIKNGLGERNLFRGAFNMLSNMKPEVAKQLITYIPLYGRYDDLLVCLETPLKGDVLKYIKDQIKEDIENKKNDNCFPKVSEI